MAGYSAGDRGLPRNVRIGCHRRGEHWRHLALRQERQHVRNPDRRGDPGNRQQHTQHAEVPPCLQGAVKGAVIIGAVLIHRKRS